MNRTTLAVAGLDSAVAVGLYCFAAFAAEADKMTIQGASQTLEEQQLFGNMATLYLDGTIDPEAGKRLEDYITANRVPRDSWAILNSPGGSLLGGMELGRVIRKYDLRTDIGKPKAEPLRVVNYEAGGCYSACTLAYLGGQFRYLASGSHFGIANKRGA